MDEREIEYQHKEYKYNLVKSKQYLGVREEQLKLILDLATKNYDANELRGMLKLIAKTDSWEKDYYKLMRSK